MTRVLTFGDDNGCTSNYGQPYHDVCICRRRFSTYGPPRRRRCAVCGLRVIPDTSETFTSWLLAQGYRDDALGDLARDVDDDLCWPRDGKLEELTLHLQMHGSSPDALRTLREAFKAYRRAQDA